jgi:hypothetical protein
LSLFIASHTSLSTPEDHPKEDRPKEDHLIEAHPNEGHPIKKRQKGDKTKKAQQLAEKSSCLLSEGSVPRAGIPLAHILIAATPVAGEGTLGLALVSLLAALLGLLRAWVGRR